MCSKLRWPWPEYFKIKRGHKLVMPYLPAKFKYCRPKNYHPVINRTSFGLHTERQKDQWTCALTAISLFIISFFLKVLSAAQAIKGYLYQPKSVNFQCLQKRPIFYIFWLVQIYESQSLFHRQSKTQEYWKSA